MRLVYVVVVNLLLLDLDERAHVDDFLWTIVKDLMHLRPSLGGHTCTVRVNITFK